MKITITTPGDPSVGLQGDYVTVDWNWDLEELAEATGGRETLRQAFSAFFEQWTDGKPLVQFEGEGCEETD